MSAYIIWMFYARVAKYGLNPFFRAFYPDNPDDFDYLIVRMISFLVYIPISG